MSEIKRKTNIQLLALLCLNYFIYSLITNIAGAVLPYWKDTFHLSSVILTFLGSVIFLAYGLTSFPQGILLDKIGNKKLLLWGLGLVFLGSISFAIFPIYYVGLASLFIIGIGVTAIQMVSNLLVKEIDEDETKYSRNLTLTQIFCGVGGLSGGFLASFLIKDLGFTWESLYYVFSVLAMVLSAWVLFTNIPEQEKTEESTRPTLKDYIELVKNPMMFMFALGIFVYVGIEVGVATWLSTFLVDKFEMLKSSAAMIVGLYWGFLAIGRFAGGILLNWLNVSKALLLYAIGAFISLVVAVVVPDKSISAMGFVAVGFFASIMFPSIFSLCVNSFDKKEEGCVAGILNTAIVGGAVTAPVIGFVAKLTSLPVSLLIICFLSFGYIGFIGLRTIPKKEG